MYNAPEFSNLRNYFKGTTCTIWNEIEQSNDQGIMFHK